MDEKIKQIGEELSAMIARMDELQREFETIAQRIAELSAETTQEVAPEAEPEPVNLPVEIPEPEIELEPVEMPESTESPKPIRLPISDRFLFQRELFNNDAGLMASVLHQLEQMSSFDEAERYLVETLGLNPADDCSKIFIAAIARHFDPRSTLLA